MGIRGLRNYLLSKLSGILCPCTLPQSSTLVVDGDGWLFQLIETSAQFHPELGGCYKAFDESITAEIERLRLCGLQIVVYFDGPEQRMKLHTSALRDAQREEQWSKVFDFCEDRVTLSNNDSFPLPVLCKVQLVAALKRNGVSITFCRGEADQEIAKVVNAGNAGFVPGEEMFYAYGRDSDYIVMKGCPYIEFGTIETILPKKQLAEKDTNAMQQPAAVEKVNTNSPIPKLRMRQSPSKASKLRQKPVFEAQCLRIWRRTDVCEALSITEAQLIDWTILIGNDYTSHFDRNTSYDWSEASESIEANKGFGEGSLLVALETILKLGGARLRAAPGAEELQRAIAFSNCIYELLPIDEFPLDFSEDSGEEDEVPEACGDLLKNGCIAPKDVDLWFEFDPDRFTFFSDFPAYLETEIASLGGQSKKRLCIAEHALRYLRQHTSYKVSDKHFAAFENMLKRIYDEEEAGKTAKGPKTREEYNMKLLAVPRWDDFVASYAFQKTCLLMLKRLPKESYSTKNNYPINLYHGYYFYTALQLCCASSSASQQVPLVLPTPAIVATAATPADGSNKNQNEQAEGKASEPASDSRSETLPIDAFREEIIERISRDRVTIIHGETGCGKSSCLPRFLLEYAESTVPKQHCQIIVSQPRRIAVTSLLRRLRQSLGKKVGMKMGHGVRDDFPETKIHYVTTGYLVRALAHQPQSFSKCTHLIIDEVHERSVDGDLVCLLARDLLKLHPTLRVVLMSATIHTTLYRNYFAQQDDGQFGEMDCLSVGVRRFPVTITYPEDLMSSTSVVSQRASSGAFMSQIQAASRDIITHSSSGIEGPVPAKLAPAQYKAAVALVRAVCEVGTGVLIFVSGINDITELVQMFEPFSKYLVFPIHSDIPADEQELAFGVTPADKVKVVVATNAAESSVTIPDCDVVICLGTHKSLQYSAISHRTQLVNTWISKASSTQRAGRTGRVRPGQVFRLYSSKLFDSMHEHEVAEVHRRPLQDVLLSMWVMLEDAVGFKGVTPFLEGMIEAPDVRNIAKSYQCLYESDLITHPSDEGFLTAVGRLSGELPVDITLGRMIAYGVMLGVVEEAIVLAAALTLPKSPFRYANAMYSSPEEYNSIIRAKFLSAAEYDAGAYSEPIALMNLLNKWRTLNQRQYPAFCFKRGLVQAVMKQFRSMADHLAHTVSSRLKPAKDKRRETKAGLVDITCMRTPTNKTLNILRLILFWSSSGNVLRMKNKAKKQLIDTSVLVHSSEVTVDHMDSIFGKTVPYKIDVRGKRVYDAHLAYWRGQDFFEPLVTLLDNLFEMSTSFGSNVDCTWVVVKSDSNNSTLVVLVLPVNERTESVLGLLSTHVFPQEGRLTSEGRDLAQVIEQNMTRLENAIVLVVRDASKSEIRRLNDFRDLLEGSLSVLIPVVGTAKLTASNCCPSDADLQVLFLGSDAVMSGAETKIACQITNSRCLLTFPEDDGAMMGGVIHTSDSSTEGSECEKFIRSSTSDAYSILPLIHDLPLGHRLISCCQQQIGRSRSKHLVLKRSEVEVKDNARAVVPGSIQYAKRQQDVTSSVDLSFRKEDSKLEVTLGCISASWVNIRSLKTTPVALNQEEIIMESSTAAILSRQTLLSCSYHRGVDSLFAVAHTSLLLGDKGALVACEGVTFLPPGATWIYLALTCAGANAQQLFELCPDVKDELQLEHGQEKCAEEVAVLLRGASTIVPRSDITDLIYKVFNQQSWDESAVKSDNNEDDDSFCCSEVEALMAGLSLDEDDSLDRPCNRKKMIKKKSKSKSTLPPSVPVIVQQNNRSKKVKESNKRDDKNSSLAITSNERKVRRSDKMIQVTASPNKNKNGTSDKTLMKPIQVLKTGKVKKGKPARK